MIARLVIPALMIVGATIAMVVLVRPPEAEPPPSPSLKVEGREVISKALGLRLVVEAAWTIEQPKSGPDVILTSTVHGASMVAKAITRDEPLTTAMAELEELHKRRYGTVENVDKLDGRLAHLPAKVIALTVTTPQGKVRSEVSVAKSGPYEMSFSCSGLVELFTVAREGCDALLAKLELKPR